MSTEIDFDPDETAAEAPAVPTLRDRMAAWLEEQHEPATVAQIVDALGAHVSTVERHLSTLQNQGRALCVGVESSDTRRRYGARLWVAGPVPDGWER